LFEPADILKRHGENAVFSTIDLLLAFNFIVHFPDFGAIAPLVADFCNCLAAKPALPAGLSAYGLTEAWPTAGQRAAA
jgi:hypothetical protein